MLIENVDGVVAIGSLPGNLTDSELLLGQRLFSLHRLALYVLGLFHLGHFHIVTLVQLSHCFDVFLSP